MPGPGRPFEKGWEGGPGRPRKEVERAYCDVTKSVITLDEWRQIVVTALTDAKKGDKVARQWISEELGTQRIAALDAEIAAVEARAQAEQATRAPPPEIIEPTETTSTT